MHRKPHGLPGSIPGPTACPRTISIERIGRYQFIKYWVLRVRKSTTLRVLKQTAILLPNQGDNHDTDYIHSTSRSLGERDVLVASRAFGGLHHIISDSFIALGVLGSPRPALSVLIFRKCVQKDDSDGHKRLPPNLGPKAPPQAPPIRYRRW